MRRFLAFLFLLVLVVLAGATALLWERMNFTGPGPAAARGEETVILIPAGAGVARIAQELQDAGVVANGQLFQWGVRLRGEAKALKAGEYAIPSRASMDDIAAILISGHSIEHKVTVAEGLTSAMAYALVETDATLTGDAGPAPAEGRLLPETYLFTRGTTRAELIHRMEAAQKKLIAKLWPGRAANLPFDNPRAAVILASIVEKESALPGERRHIAAVFENRLRLGMKLQSDPTIIYGLTKGYPLGHGIRQSELSSSTPYNTYVIDGLPPSPICNPGKDSIAAVLDPAQSADLYFVANGTGGHVFSATIDEHEKNVARWRNIERAEKQTGEPAPVPAPKRLQAKRRHRRH